MKFDGVLDHRAVACWNSNRRIHLWFEYKGKLMAKFTKIALKDAPSPTRQSGRLNLRMKEYEDHVRSLKSGEAGKLSPDMGETARGVALRISRAAKRANVSVQTWVVDGAVYFRNA